MKSKHKVYLANGNQHHVVCDRINSVSSEDSFIRFTSGSGTAHDPHFDNLIVAKEHVIAIESTRIAGAASGATNVASTYPDYYGIVTASFERQYKNRDKFDSLPGVEKLRQGFTTTVDFGRGTGKTKSALKLGRDKGCFVVTDMRQFIDDYMHGSKVLSLKTIKECENIKSLDRHYLVIDSLSSLRTLTKDEVYKFAVHNGFKHVVFLGE